MLFLGGVTLVGLVGLIVLVGSTSVKDAGLLAVVAGPTGTALGALGTLLASTRTVDSPPQEVLVTNEPTSPVPVEAQKGK